MATLSLAMIVKNEEDVLERCLSCVNNICDEIIIVDTGSADKTKIIAKKFTDKIYDFAWVNDFSAARNFAFQKATKDYVMWLDADDIIDEINQKKLKRLKSELEKYDVLMAKYDVGFDEFGNTNFSFYRERILKRSFGFKWEGFIHECISPAGKIKYCDFTVQHKKNKENEPHRNLNIYEYHISLGESLSPRDQFYYARELMYNSQTEKAIYEFERFIKSRKGLHFNNVEACIGLHFCYKKLGQPVKGLHYLLNSMEFAIPSPEINCLIGDYFMENKEFKTAVYWYMNAVNSKYEDNSSFVKPDYQNFYPYLQLCVCHDKLNNIKLSEHFNDLAAKIKPNSAAVQYNKTYFSKSK